jgi:hypothetical protein
MREKTFTQAEVEAKVGKKIRTKVEFSGVPKGSTGIIVRADNMGREWDVVIEWNLAPRQFGMKKKGLEDWFTKYEYEKYLEEL